MGTRVPPRNVALFATIALLIASLIAPVAADNILFYSRITGRAAIGNVSPDGTFRDLKTHAFDLGWDHIVSASHGTLLFYNAFTGVAASGRVAADGSFTDLKTMNFDRYWTRIVPLSQGKLLFYNIGTGLVATGVLSPDGSYRDLNQTNGIGPGWHFIAETRNATLLLNRVPPSGSVGTTVTGRIGPDGSYSYRAGPQEWPYFSFVTPIYGDGLLLYEPNAARSSLALLNSGTNTDRLISVNGMGPGWAQIVSTSNDMLLLYDIWRGELTSGNLVPDSANSYKIVLLRSQVIDALWTHVVALR